MTNMNFDWDGNAVPFHNYIHYSCKHGYFFDGDRDRGSIPVECLTDGTFETRVLPSCYDSEHFLSEPLPADCHNVFSSIFPAVYCSSPLEKPEGGVRIWDEQTIFESSVTYKCPPNAKFIFPDGSLVETQESTCQWNKQFSLNSLPPCKGKFRVHVLLQT